MSHVITLAVYFALERGWRGNRLHFAHETHFAEVLCFLPLGEFNWTLCV